MPRLSLDKSAVWRPPVPAGLAWPRSADSPRYPFGTHRLPGRTHLGCAAISLLELDALVASARRKEAPSEGGPSREARFLIPYCPSTRTDSIAATCTAYRPSPAKPIPRLSRPLSTPAPCAEPLTPGTSSLPHSPATSIVIDLPSSNTPKPRTASSESTSARGASVLPTSNADASPPKESHRAGASFGISRRSRSPTPSSRGSPSHRQQVR